MHSKFTDIGQFRETIRSIKMSAQFMGMDENGEAIVDREAKMPIVSFVGTVKLHGCFHKDTEITLANGERIPIRKVEKGTNIVSYDFEKEELMVSEVINVIKNESNKEWCKLIFDDREIICTKDHKFWTNNRGWTEAQDLKESDIFITE